MMNKLIALLLATAAAMPATAQGVAVATQQSVDALGRRVGTLESQMRAVQRQVFPGGDKRFFEPEAPPAVTPPTPDATPAGAPATALLTDLTQRVDAVERQQKALTGQLEELQFKQRQLEQALAKFRADAEFRLEAIEKGPAPTAPLAEVAPPPAATAKPGAKPLAKAPAATAAATPAAAAPATTPADPEAAYRAAYARYTARDFPAAARDLQAFVAANPKHPRASNAQFWAGRALFDQGQPAQAAKQFLGGYQAYPRGERAPNSLLWLGKSLVAMKQPKAACQALDQLAAAYPEKLTGQLKADAEATRTQAQCPAQ